jgi:spoIIIJ-associated protein
MRVIEKSGKTIDEAVKAALSELNLKENDVDIEILEEPKNGFLGFIGGKDALVRVTEKENNLNKINEFLQVLFDKMRLNPEISVKEEEGNILVNLQGEDLGILIGRRGETLDSLQFLVNLFVNKSSENYKKVIIDIEDYRKKRENTLYSLAEKLSNKVKRTGRKISLEPMSPQERRIIHMALQENKSVNTYSEGEEPFRKVVIAPKRNY